MNIDTVYVFVGEGLGVPGVPHRLTKKDAEKLGVVGVLDAALANGNYAFVPAPTSAAAFNPTEFILPISSEEK